MNFDSKTNGNRREGCSNYWPFSYTLVYAVVIFAVIFPVALASDLAASIIAYLTLPFVGYRFFLYTKNILSPPTTTTSISEIQDFVEYRGPTGFIGFFDMYFFVNMALALVWETMWLLDSSTERNMQIRIDNVTGDNTNLFFVFLVLFSNTLGVFSGVGLIQIRPVSVAAYFWYMVLIACGILWITTVGQSLKSATASHMNELAYQEYSRNIKFGKDRRSQAIPANYNSINSTPSDEVV